MPKQEKVDGKLAFKAVGELDYDLVADVDQAWGAYRLHLVAKELNTKVRQALELHAYHSWEYSTTPGPMKWTENIYSPMAPFPKITVRNCLRLWRLEFYRWMVTKCMPKVKCRERAIQWLLRQRQEKVEYHERLFQRTDTEKTLDNLCECAVAQASFLIERKAVPQMLLLGSRSAGAMLPLLKYQEKKSAKEQPALRLEVRKADHRERIGADYVVLTVMVDHALNEDAVLVV